MFSAVKTHFGEADQVTGLTQHLLAHHILALCPYPTSTHLIHADNGDVQYHRAATCLGIGLIASFGFMAYCKAR